MSTLSTVIENDQMERIVKEFSRLGDRCYLENAGATLYPQMLLNQVNEDLLNNVYMNPHSDKYTRDCIEQIRTLVLKHFNTDSSEYAVIFTSGTTQALKLVVESFQFGSDCKDSLNCGSFVYLRDNHTSVLGLRELAAEKNADIIHISHNDFLQSLGGNVPLKENPKEKYNNDSNTLLVYPAQSNFNGYKYPINNMDKIKDGCLNNYIRKHLCQVNCNWYVLLDAASYVPTSKLDLSKTKPDFICMSFYKIFGYPTGLGALIVKNTSANVLNQKTYFGGGTVDIVLSSEDFHVKRKDLHERFEDGTLPFLSILALKHCFSFLNCIVPKAINDDLMETISHHCFYLAKDLYKQLKTLQHANGSKAAVLYMDSNFEDVKMQGGVVTFNILRDNGSFIGYSEFQHMSDLFGISIRTGCFCNSGSCQRHLNVTNKEMKDMYNAGHVCGDQVDLINGRPTGAVRASFSYYNTYLDVDKLIMMITRCFMKIKYIKPKRYMISTKHILDSNKKINKSNEIVQEVKKDNFIRNLDIIANVPQHHSKPFLKEIAIYPVKSCGAFKIKSAWMIGPKGFHYDREWMIIKDNGVCLTQKQNARMCMIRPIINLKKKVLILHFKGKKPISVPLDISYEFSTNISICQSKICTDTIKGFDCGEAVADWISEALEISYLRLIRQSSSDERSLKTKNIEVEKKLLSFSNQAQYLLINSATVRWLEEKIKDPSFNDTIEQLTDRFRGNLIIETEQELIEREWQRVYIGKHEFKVEGQCSRCQMVCIDQQTGEKTVEPLRTISEEFAGKMRFGIYLSYVGPLNGSKDSFIETGQQVKPVQNDDNVSR